jgi:hypothetical protein
MRPRPFLAISLVCTVLAAGAYGVAVAGEPAPSSSSEASPGGGWVPPDTSSKKPEAAEWDGAKPLELLRKHCSERLANGECQSTCSAKVLREWVQVTCSRAKQTEVFMGVRVLAGPADDVSLVDPPEPKGGAKGQRGFSLVFPVRRGDRRTIEVAEMLPLMWKAWTVEERLDMVISAMWLPNAARPVVTVY